MSHFLPMTIFFLATLLFIGKAQADCENKIFTCPSGQTVNQGMCWDLLKLKCEPCSDWRKKCNNFPKYHTNRWMGDLISGDKSLSEIIMPGSHDAGMYIKHRRDCTSHATQCNTMTQDKSIKKQLEAGVRWFDIRVVYSPDTKEVASNYITGHWQDNIKQLKLGTQGCLGGALSKIHSDVSSFLENNKDEIVILYYSHFYNWKEKKNLDIDKEKVFVEQVKKDLGTKLYVTSKDDFEKISTIPIARIRGEGGRVIATFDFRSGDRLISPEEGILGSISGLKRTSFEVNAPPNTSEFSDFDFGTCGVRNISLRQSAETKNKNLYKQLGTKKINIFTYDMVNQENNKQIIYNNKP